MTIITIDDKKYELADLSSECKGQIGSLRYVDAEIQRLQAKLAVLHTARNAYARAASEYLPKESSKKK